MVCVQSEVELTQNRLETAVEFGYIIHGIYHPAASIGHFRPEPNFDIIKPSGYIIQPSGYIGHFERCQREHLRA